MPSEMTTFRQPAIPEIEDVDQYPNVLIKLTQLLAMVKDCPCGERSCTLNLDDLNETERRLVDQFLGEGEVSIVLEGDQALRVQESVLAGIWRVQSFDTDNNLQQDCIEVAGIPRAVLQPVNLRDIKADDNNTEA